MKLVINGTVPSLKNSKQIFRTASGRPFITSSDKAKTWMTEKKVEIMQAKLPKMKIDESSPVSISMTFYNSTKRKSDIDNKITTFLDLFKNCGIIPDDNCFIVSQVVGIFGGVDKNNPRTEISIEYFKR